MSDKPRLIAQIVIDDDKMENIKNDYLERIQYNIKEIKAEVYKEVASLFTSRLVNMNPLYALGYRLAILQIDNLLKELEGDNIE